MDFFEQQDRARKGTGRLIALFALALIGTTAMVYGLVLLVVVGSGYTNIETAGAPRADVPWLEMLVWTWAGVTLTIGLGSIFKIASLRSGGGASVARSLGGMPISPDTNDPDERKVLNVVEEMSIASGVPVPPVFMMGNETGINAFAAGYKPETAVIGVTRGCVERLSRDELQGVIAHEFSHILNGDMRLNIRLIGVVFGILALTVIGRIILRSAIYSGSSRSSRDNGGGKLAMLAIGVALIIIGYLGVLFGKLIQAAVSRQREYLADASAVQFTRNPEGLSGALKRIGGLVSGGKVSSPHAEETAHMFFANALSSLGGAFATHPPLPDRIRRLDPRWDGKFIGPEAGHTAPTPLVAEAASGLIGGTGPAAATRPPAVAPGPAESVAVMDSIGRIDQAHVAHARALIDAMPEPVRTAAHQPAGARALVYALLLDRDEAVQRRQLDVLAAKAPVPIARQAATLAGVVAEMPRELRLPAVDLAVPALAAMAQPEYRRFAIITEALIGADRRVDLFEWALRQVVARHIGVRFERHRPERVRHHRVDAVRGPVGTVLSALAHLGQGGDPAAAERAFRTALTELDGLGDLELAPRDDAAMRAVSDALDELIGLAPLLKRQVVRACIACVSADGRITGGEAELLRVVVEAMGVPIPPLLPGPVAAASE